MNSIPRKFLKPKIGGAIYILPNLLTSGNLFFGYYSIIKSIQMDFWMASIAILLASIFDMLDGRVARLTHSTSQFGVQYDSLCDLVSFGVAPSVMMFMFGLNHYGRLGFIVCFIYMACGALRLARFNVQASIIKSEKEDDFTGLPIPIPAVFIACFIAFISSQKDHLDLEFSFIDKTQAFMQNTHFNQPFLLIMALILAFLMVSSIAYRSHKSLKFKSIKPFRLLATLVAVGGCLSFQPTLSGFIVIFCYVLFGLVEWVLGWKKPKNEDEIFAADEGEEEELVND